MKINKEQFIERYAERHNVTKKEATELFNKHYNLVGDILTDGNSIDFTGIESYEIVDVKGRSGVSKLQGAEKSWTTEDSKKVKATIKKSFSKKVLGE